MLKELKEKISKFNKIVGFQQKGFLSDKEFEEAMEAERKAQGIEGEWHNADLMQDEMEEIGMEEVRDVEEMEDKAFAEKAEEEQRQQYEDSVL